MRKLLVVLAILAGIVLSGCVRENDMAIHITTLEQLQAMKDNLSEDYILDNDIDATATSGWNEGLGFEPVGNGSSFTGTFDGQGHKITGLYINRPTAEDDVGLFGNVQTSGNIKNVILKNCNITAKRYVGGLIGWIGEGTVSQCGSEGAISGEQILGGLVGQVSIYATVSRCYSKGTVTSTYTGPLTWAYVGGLVGLAKTEAISNCYSHATVIAQDKEYVGGLVGKFIDDLQGTLENCCSTGVVTSDADHVGGLIGGKDPETTVSNSFWDTETSGQATSDGGTGKTTEQMKTKSTFTGWDLDTIWNICEGIYIPSYPWFRWQGVVGDICTSREAPWDEDTLEVGGTVEVEIPRRSGNWVKLEDIIRIHTSRGKDTSSPRAPIEIGQAELTCSNISKKFNSFEEASEWFKSLEGYAIRIWVSWD